MRTRTCMCSCVIPVSTSLVCFSGVCYKKGFVLRSCHVDKGPCSVSLFDTSELQYFGYIYKKRRTRMLANATRVLLLINQSISCNQMFHFP